MHEVAQSQLVAITRPVLLNTQECCCTLRCDLGDLPVLCGPARAGGLLLGVLLVMGHLWALLQALSVGVAILVGCVLFCC